MAITILESPDKFTPAFNPVRFSISSDNYSQPDFKFVLDIYNGSGTLLATLKPQPNIQGSTPVEVDISRVLQELVAADYCKFNDVVSPAIVVTSGAGISGYSVQFGEQYGGVVHANLNSSSGFVFNGAINFYRWAFYSDAKYVNKKFLTGTHRQINRKRDSAMLSILQSDTAAITNFQINIFDAQDDPIYSTTVANPYTSLSTVNNRMLHLHVGFDYLYARLAFGTSVYNDAQYYTITPNGGEPYTFQLHSRCERFPGTRVYFLNELGGFDAFNFLLPDRFTQVADRKTYDRRPLDLKAAYDPVMRRFEATNRTYTGSYHERIRLASDYLTDSESIHLTGLIPSPLVYLEKPAIELGGALNENVMIPVKIQMNEWGLKKEELDKLFTLELDVDLVHPTYRQNT